MAKERLGFPLSPAGMKPIDKPENVKEPGFGWVLTDPYKSQIESVQENLRAAEQRTGSVILR